MLEVALIEDMNDSDEDAQRLVDFSKSIINERSIFNTSTGNFDK